MRRLFLLSGCGVLLGATMAVAADDGWRPAAGNGRSDAAPSNGVRLGKPRAKNQERSDMAPSKPTAPDLDDAPSVHVVRYAEPIVTARAQRPGVPVYPGAPTPASPEEDFNCGVVTQGVTGPTTPTGHGNIFSGLFSGNLFQGTFQSDHCFDRFISPVSNPFFFEDPRALTELRPIFIYQHIPGSNPLFHGGSFEGFFLQGRL